MVSVGRNVYRKKQGPIIVLSFLIWVRQRLCLPLLFLVVVLFSIFLGGRVRHLLQLVLLYGPESAYQTFAPPGNPIDDSELELEWAQFVKDYKNRFGGGLREPPASLRQWIAFAKTNQCNVREFYSTPNEDLQFYRDIIVQQGRPFGMWEIFSNGLQNTDNHMGLLLKNHMLTVVTSHNFGGDDRQQNEIEQRLRWLLEPVRMHAPPLHAAYFFNLHDGPINATRYFNKTVDPPESASRPIFSVCKQAYWTDGAVLPTQDDQQRLRKELQGPISISSIQHNHNPYHKDFNDWSSFRSRDLLVPYHFGFSKSLPRNPNPLPFENRRDAIVWRGSTTGNVWGFSPRFRLVSEYGGTGPHSVSESVKDVMLDFAFVDVVQNIKNATLAPGSRVGQHERLSLQQLQEYKYILDVDGNAFTERFPNQLQSGSLIFKSTRYKEWYTERLKPYIDYIPVNYNFSDLVEKVEWAHNHFDLTSQMVLHAQKISKNYLRKEDMRCYVYRLMLEYQTLFEN